MKARDYRHVCERLAEAIVIVEADGARSYANPAARRLLSRLRGFDPELPVRQADRGVVDTAGRPLTGDDLPSEITRLTGRELDDVEIGVPGPDGSLRWLRVSTRRLDDPDTLPCAVVSTYVDVSLRHQLAAELAEVTSFADSTDQRRAEAARMEATEAFETSFAHAPTGIALVGIDGRLMRANAALCRILGRDEQQLIDTPPSAYTHVDDQGATEGVLERLGGGERAATLEKRYLRPDGQVVWTSIQTATVRDATGRPSHVVAHVQDITALKDAERQRSEAMRLFETVFSSAPIAIALFDLEMRLQRANPGFYAMLGRDPEELVGHSLHGVTHPADLPTTADAGADLRAASGGTTDVQKRYVRPDGSIVWAQTQTTTICDAEGQPSFVVSHLRDISAEKAAETKQAETTAQFEAAFSDGPIAMAVVSLTGRWIRVNRRLCQLLGYTEDELLSTTFQEITHPDDVDADLELVRQLMAGEIGRYALEKRYRTADGSLLWARLAVSLVRDADGVPLHFISQIVDLTERKRLERELQHMADHDWLTGTVNRRRFDEALAVQVRRSRRYHERAALLAVDLNEFKAINDTHGHRAGDAVLVAVGRALQRRLRATDLIARVGGDEFAVILINVTLSEAEKLAATLRETIAALRVPIPGATLSTGASIGVAVIDAATPDPNAVFTDADAAMYRDKARGHAASVTPSPVRPQSAARTSA